MIAAIDTQLMEIYTTLKELAKSGKIRVLFSLYTLLEILKYHKKEERDKLIDLIVDVSNGWVLKPSIDFATKEVENAFSFLLQGKYVHNIHSDIVGRGYADIAGLSFEQFWQDHCSPDMPFLSLDLLYYLKKDFKKFNEDLGIMKKNLKGEETRQWSQNTLSQQTQILDGIEVVRQKNSQMTKNEFLCYSYAYYIKPHLWHIARFLHKNKIEPRNDFSPYSNDLFRKNLNSGNVLVTLATERDFGTAKPINSHDACDIAHLSGSIPYCDIVVTDTMFATICCNKQLDVLYNCNILNDLNSLAQIEKIT